MVIHLIYHYKSGNTPLHLAAKHGQATIVKYLLEQGAEKSAKNEVRTQTYYYSHIH